MSERHAGKPGGGNPADRRPRIAIFDYEVTEVSPSGSCHLRLLEGLHGEYDFTVFATRFSNPAPDRIRWVRVPAVTRPLAARYLSYYAVSGAASWWHRRWTGPADPHLGFDLVQAVEGYTPFFDISYVHFCHSGYLRKSARWPTTRGPRAAVRRLDHRLRAGRERQDLSRARLLVVPAAHLMEELHAELGFPRDRFRVVPNPVLLSTFRRPADFQREGFRHGLGVRPDDLLLVFVALGHFERKGLPVLLAALDRVPDLNVRLVVVGGDPDLVARYRSRTAGSSSANRVRFVGLQPDVRPYLWAADALVAPSNYEVFSLAPLQAAATGLPLIVTRVPGVAPFFVDGEQGYAVDGDAVDLESALRRLEGLSSEERRRLGAAALRAVQPYGVESFVDNWRGLYRELLAPPHSNGS